jgi:hypothetical protein
VRRAGVHARRVEAIEAAVRLMQRLRLCEGRIDIGEVSLDLFYIQRCAEIVGHLSVSKFLIGLQANFR